jgi:hypothetical protein
MPDEILATLLASDESTSSAGTCALVWRELLGRTNVEALVAQAHEDVPKVFGQRSYHKHRKEE